MKNTSRPTRLRPFTGYDWDAFSGCSSTDPLIAEGPNYTLILDGTSVEFLLDPDGREGPSWDREFPNDEYARRVAFAILASPIRGVVTALLDLWEDGEPDDGHISF